MKMLIHFKAKIEQRLKQHGIRATRHRIRVLEVLENTGKPMSHIELLQAIQAEDPGFDRVTLYRVLNALKDAAFIHQIQGSDGIWRFCAHETDDDLCPGGHPHLLCEICGEMQCLKTQKLPHVDVPEGFKVKHKQMILIGICAKCQSSYP